MLRGLAVAIMPLLQLQLLVGCAPTWQLQNPYADVDWEHHRQYKANLHTHTMVSDGWENPQTVVDMYKNLDYHILAITDHRNVTYPWDKFSTFPVSAKTKKRLADKLPRPQEADAIAPEDLFFKDVKPGDTGLLDIQGDELVFKGHDINSYFNDYNGKFSSGTLDTVAEKGGLMVFCHPGRYKLPMAWYKDLYQHHAHLVGIEVFNCGNRYPNDRRLWDSLLTQGTTRRPLWGYSNDDMHSLRDLGRNWNVMILPVLDRRHVRRAMERGTFYFVNAPQGHKGPTPPEIKAIIVNERTISIQAVAADSIRWICNGTRIHKGSHLSANKLPKHAAYIRAELFGRGNTLVCTQPFIVMKSTNATL
jgi:hypothetical protein